MSSHAILINNLDNISYRGVGGGGMGGGGALPKPGARSQAGPNTSEDSWVIYFGIEKHLA